jgi:DNA-binding NarL/FixJ family response regulator
MTAQTVPATRVIMCEDNLLFREGVTRLLEDNGFDVAARCEDGEQLVRCADEVAADVVLVDVRMPPSYTDEGLRAALELGRRHPQLGVLVLSHVVETSATLRLLEQRGGGGRGYLLKDRVTDLDGFTSAIKRVAAGESVVDPDVFASLVSARRTAPIDRMSARESEILGLMAEGRSNAAICDHLVLSPRTVESHVSSIFRKLGLRETPDDNRRVLAVLAYLRA